MSEYNKIGNITREEQLRHKKMVEAYWTKALDPETREGKQWKMWMELMNDMFGNR
jgi:hypothetical protein|tara:strand:- start:63 stop:227 length:165 start_codon:yes stop_codon:yes gene_type:complete